MKFYEVEMTMTFTKTIHVKAPNEEAAEALAETIFMDTDALSLTPADLEDFEAFAMPIDDSADDDDCDCCCGDDLEDEEEYPFDNDSQPEISEHVAFLQMISHILESIADHEVHIHISPGD